MKKPWQYHASKARVLYGPEPGIQFKNNKKAHRLMVGMGDSAETVCVYSLYEGWAAQLAAEAAIRTTRSPLSTERLEVSLTEVGSGEVVRAVIYNPTDEDLERAERWRQARD